MVIFSYFWKTPLETTENEQIKQIFSNLKDSVNNEKQ